eukprot:6862759-Prymnesium_polylepis.1
MDAIYASFGVHRLGGCIPVKSFATEFPFEWRRLKKLLKEYRMKANEDAGRSFQNLMPALPLRHVKRSRGARGRGRKLVREKKKEKEANEAAKAAKALERAKKNAAKRQEADDKRQARKQAATL